MNLTKLASLGIALLFIQACSHPIEIVGEGDVTSASGNRNCSLEQFDAADTVCAKNYAIGAYQETYYATPRSGWKFDHWNYCADAAPPNYECSFNVDAAAVRKFWGQTVPPLKAVFFPLYQTCQNELPSSTPTSRFTDHGNGTVTDTQTGLMWAKCPTGLSGASCRTGTASGTYWQEALDLAEGSALANYSDWRLPNPEELWSIVDERCNEPSINLEVFPNTLGSSMWTSKPDGGEVWVVDFSDAEIVHDHPVDNTNQFRLVRGTEIVTVPDTDQDGIPDSNDSCPNTPPGDMVDAQGCTVVVDTDSDGIPDVTDNCPNISNANQADFNIDGEGDACDTDVDGDGVPNDGDICPLTLLGSVIFRYGCSRAEFDTDADGVPDGADWVVDSYDVGGPWYSGQLDSTLGAHGLAGPHPGQTVYDGFACAVAYIDHMTDPRAYANCPMEPSTY